MVSIAEQEWQAYLEKFIDVVSYVIVWQCWIKHFKICIIHIFKNKTWSLWLLVSDDIKQLHNIRPSTKILQYFNLPLNLRLAHNKMLNIMAVYKAITQESNFNLNLYSVGPKILF